MEEAAENGKESSHSAHANGMNEHIKYFSFVLQVVRVTIIKHWSDFMQEVQACNNTLCVLYLQRTDWLTK
jgi:hypothetical protein